MSRKKLPDGSIPWSLKRCVDLYGELAKVIGKPLAAATMKHYGMSVQAEEDSSDYCCQMRAKFILGIAAEVESIPTPSDVVDYLDFDTLTPDGRHLLRIKFCPFCGVYVRGPLGVQR